MERKTICQHITVAADASGRVTFAPCGSTERWKVKAITLIPNATSAANDTNYATITPKKGSTALTAARSTTVDGTALTADTPENLALTAVGADLEITQADPMHVLCDATPGSGVALDLSIQAEFEVERV